MHLDHLWITDFRNYATAELSPAPSGLTVIIGNNGEGKTNLLEAVGYLATLRSFRGSPPEALIRIGAGQAIVRAEADQGATAGAKASAAERQARTAQAEASAAGQPARTAGAQASAADPPAGAQPPGAKAPGAKAPAARAPAGAQPPPAAPPAAPPPHRQRHWPPGAPAPALEGRPARRLLIEAELHNGGRDRVQVNRQPLRRARDLLGALPVTVFAPDDLALIKAGPQGRREYLDDLLVGLHPRNDLLRSDLDRILKQRNALLKQAAGNPRPSEDIITTLDVWDQKLAETGTALADARDALVDRLRPTMAGVYDQLAERAAHVAVDYHRSWNGELCAALAAARTEDLRRGITTLGPQRDDLVLTLGGMPSRTHASQGEQRSLALALRLAGHLLLADELGSPPVLLLDDVFSELDADRSRALLESLPPGQALVTTAGQLPPMAHPETVVRVEGGKILP